MSVMRAAGIRRYSGPVEPMELPGPGELRPDELLIDLACLRLGTNGQAVVLHPGLAAG